MSSAPQNIQEEKKQYWYIFIALVVLNIFVVMTRHIPVIFWAGVLSAFSIVLMLFMHLKTEKRFIQMMIFVTVLPNVIGLVALIVLSNFSVPEGTRYLNFDYPPKSNTTGNHEQPEHQEAEKPAEHHGS